MQDNTRLATRSARSHSILHMQKISHDYWTQLTIGKSQDY